MRSRSLVLLLTLGGAAGEREEDVVERRRAERDVVDSDPRLVEPPDGVGDRPAAVAKRDANEPVLGERLSVRDRRDGGESRLDAAVLELDLEPLAADAGLERGRRALGDQRPVIDDGDSIREAVRLVEVLRRQQDGGPARDERLDRLPEPDPA